MPLNTGGGEATPEPTDPNPPVAETPVIPPSQPEVTNPVDPPPPVEEEV